MRGAGASPLSYGLCLCGSGRWCRCLRCRTLLLHSPTSFRLRRELRSNGQAGASLLPFALCSASSHEGLRAAVDLEGVFLACRPIPGDWLPCPGWPYQTRGPLGITVSFCACLSGNSYQVPPLVPSLCPNDGIAELAAGRGSDDGEGPSSGAVVGSGDREVVMAAGSAVLTAKPYPLMLPGLM